LDIASQGDSIEQARDNLREALELFFETAPQEEVKFLKVGTLRSIVRQSGLPRTEFED
jgi:predicted RNase H-like HicB family nuclease